MTTAKFLVYFLLIAFYVAYTQLSDAHDRHEHAVASMPPAHSEGRSTH